MIALEIETLIRRTIAKIAPEADLESLNANVRFRDQFDFDSVDFVNFIKQIQDILHIKITETDYPQMASLNGCIAYLSEKQIRDQDTRE